MAGLKQIARLAALVTFFKTFLFTFVSPFSAFGPFRGEIVELMAIYRSLGFFSAEILTGSGRVGNPGNVFLKHCKLHTFESTQSFSYS